jgi:hypothetical protein
VTSGSFLKLAELSLLVDKEYFPSRTIAGITDNIKKVPSTGLVWGRHGVLAAAL